MFGLVRLNKGYLAILSVANFWPILSVADFVLEPFFYLRECFSTFDMKSRCRDGLSMTVFELHFISSTLIEQSRPRRPGGPAGRIRCTPAIPDSDPDRTGS